MTPLTRQELHNLAMNHVGKTLEADGYEFLGVNSKLHKDPQFVVLKDKKTSFVIVRAVQLPDDPMLYDEGLISTLKLHADKFEAAVYYAGVGLADAENRGTPVCHYQDYVINYSGLQLIE